MRRFSEFYLLFRKLRAESPGIVVPPCPEKNQLQKLRKTPDFIEARRQALEVFVNKVCSHRLLKHSELLRKFLEADETTWLMEVQRMRQSDEQATVLGTVSQVATDIFQSTKNLAKGQSDDRSEDPEYLQVSTCTACCPFAKSRAVQGAKVTMHLSLTVCNLRVAISGTGSMGCSSRSTVPTWSTTSRTRVAGRLTLWPSSKRTVRRSRRLVPRRTT